MLIAISPGGTAAGGYCQRVEKVAKATFSMGMRARWASIPGGKVGSSCARSVISEAHVPGNDGLSFSSCGCGRRNSARLSFVEGFSTAWQYPPAAQPPGDIVYQNVSPEARSCSTLPAHGSAGGGQTDPPARRSWRPPGSRSRPDPLSLWQ